MLIPKCLHMNCRPSQLDFSVMSFTVCFRALLENSTPKSSVKNKQTQSLQMLKWKNKCCCSDTHSAFWEMQGLWLKSVQTVHHLRLSCRRLNFYHVHYHSYTMPNRFDSVTHLLNLKYHTWFMTESEEDDMVMVCLTQLFLASPVILFWLFLSMYWAKSESAFSVLHGASPHHILAIHYTFNTYWQM